MSDSIITSEPNRITVTTGSLVTQYSDHPLSAAKQITLLHTQIKQLTERLAAAEAEIVNAREAARLVFHKATFIGTAKEHNRFPGWQKIAEMYTWLAQQEDDTAAKGGRDE